MKRYALIALLLVSSANAQTWQTYPNYGGGSTTYGPNGQIYQTYPNYGGGSTTYGPGGSVYQTYPNYGGGSTTYGSGSGPVIVPQEPTYQPHHEYGR